jgi:hypothetical protein
VRLIQPKAVEKEGFQMSEQEMATLAVETANATDERQNILDLLRLSTAQVDALSAKFAKLPKLQKAEVRKLEGFNTEVETYCAYVLAKMANDYLNAQMRDIWIQRLEMLIPRILTKDEKLKAATEKAVAQIASEIEDTDERANIQTILQKNLLPKSSDKFTLLQCFERTEEIFTLVWKKS